MELKLLSDLHLEHYVSAQVFPHVGEGNVLVLAGDILCAKHLKSNGYLRAVYKRFLSDCSKNYDQVFYVLGNHEFYGYNYEGAKKKIAENLPDNFTLLDDNVLHYNGWDFVGMTLWTGFRNANPLEMLDAERFMNDYKSIRIGPNYRKLRATDTVALHNRSKNYLLDMLRVLNDNVFVISHHAPSFQSVAPHFKSAELNGAYCTDLDGLILNHPKIKYWAHGHTHNRFDYMIGECRVLCNPVGYPGHDAGFDKNLTISL